MRDRDKLIMASLCVEVGPQTEPGVRLPSLTTFMGSWSGELPPIGELYERIKRVYDERLDEALDRI